MSRLSLYLLGPPRVERDGTPVQIRRRKAVALLAYLAVTGSSHSREKLATLLWPESDQGRALANLRVALVALKDALGEDWLDIDREIVGLNPDVGPSAVLRTGPSTLRLCSGQALLGVGPSTGALAGSARTSGQVFWLDVAEFRGRLAACGTHDHPPEEACPACLSSLAEAVALYGDDFLAGFTLPNSPAFDEWQFFQTESLRGELAGALERLVHGHSRRGEYGPAIPYARRWAALDPLHEPAHRRLMQLYAWSGQRAAALRQYAECERLLREELDAPPEEETSQLFRTIRAHRELPPPVVAPEEAAAAPVAPPVSPPGATRHNLPASATPFIGREAQLAGVREMLVRPEVRLLTLTGAGGSGKTRLALEVAAGLLDAFPDGVFFVPLAPVGDPALVVPTVATTLGVRQSAGRSLLESLQYSLRDRHLLLVVDNFEHLLPAAPALSELLSVAPRLKALVTSRAPLHVYGEHEYAVPPMAIPGPDGLPPLQRLAQVEAVKLFVQRAQAARADFALGQENAPAVAEICTRLDGLPLAIELAAAWGRMLTPAEIARELERGLDFLETEWRDVPARQRSMRAVFDHSWRLLGPREREVLQVASVFRGGFARGAAERVAGALLRELRSLVGKSLLQRTPAGRYEMHELFRQYAGGKLDEAPEARVAACDRHCAFYIAALERWEAELKGPGQVNALAEMGAEVGNARAAWEWVAKQGCVERLDQGLDGLCRFYEWRGRYQEGEAACRAAEEALTLPEETAAVSAPGDRGRVLAKALVWRAVFAQAMRHVGRVIPLLQRGLAHLERCASGGMDVRQEKAFALWQMADACYSAGREDAGQWYEKSLALYRALGDRWGMASVLFGLGHDVLGMSGAFEEGEALVRESLAIRQALGDQRGVAMSRRSVAQIVCLQGRVEECERLLRQSLAAFRAVGDRVDTAGTLSNLSYVLLFLGQPAEACSLAAKSAAILNELGLRDWVTAQNLSSRGANALWLGRYEQARAFTEAGLAVAQEIGRHNILAACLSRLGMVAIVEEDYARALQLLGESVATARQVGHFRADSYVALLGLAALGQGQPRQARRYLYEGLRAAVEKGSYIPLMYALPPVAYLLATEGEMTRAVEVYALALQQPFVGSSRWYEDVVGRHIAAAAATLPPDVVAAAQERGRSWDLWVAARELAADLATDEG